MKKLLIPFAIALCAVCFIANAGLLTAGFTGASATSNTNNVAAAATNTYSPSFSPFPTTTGRFLYLSASAQFAGSGSAQSNLTICASVSSDSVHWITNAYRFNVSGSNIFGTNLDLGSTPFFNIQALENPNTNSTYYTNIFINAFVKPGI